MEKDKLFSLYHADKLINQYLCRDMTLGQGHSAQCPDLNLLWLIPKVQHQWFQHLKQKLLTAATNWKNKVTQTDVIT